MGDRDTNFLGDENDMGQLGSGFSLPEDERDPDKEKDDEDVGFENPDEEEE